MDHTKIFKSAIPLSRVRPVTSYNVLDYGARGDGIQDDSAAILASDIAASLVGGVVYFPAGTYLIQTTVSRKSGVTWRGEGRGVSILREHPLLGNAPLISFGTINGTQLHDIGFEKLTIRNGTATTGLATSQDGVIALNVARLRVTDCEFTEIQGHYGLKVRQCSDVVVSGTRFYRWTYAAIMVLTECQNVHVINACEFDTAVSTAEANTYTVANGAESNAEGVYHVRGFYVQGCRFRNVTKWEGLDSHGGENIWFTDNDIEDVYFGIQVGLVSSQVTSPVLRGVHIERNRIKSGNHQNPDAGGYGIVVTGDLPAVNTPYFAEDVHINGNRIDGFGRYFADPTTCTIGAITLYLVRNFEVRSNTCDDYNGSALVLYHSCWDGVVDDLTVRDRHTSGTGVSDAYVITIATDGIYGVQFGKIIVAPRTAAAAPKYLVYSASEFTSTTWTREWNISNLGTAVKHPQSATLPIELVSIPAYGSSTLVQKYGDQIWGLVGYWNVRQPVIGYFGFDIVTTLCTVAATAGNPTLTLATGPANANWRRVPVGANIVVNGAGPAAGDLLARVIANDGLTLTLDTAASTSQASAPVKWATQTAGGASLTRRSHWQQGTYMPGDATPNVAGCDVMWIANSTPTTITDLTGGEPGQEITLMFGDANTTITQANVVLNIAGNYVSANNKSITLRKSPTDGGGGYWWDISLATAPAFGSANISTTGTLQASSIRDTGLSTGLVHSDNAGNFTSSLGVNADIANGAAIAWTKIAPNIVNADVNSAAAIDGSKINPNFGSQTLTAGSTTVNGFTNQGYGAGVVHAAAGGGTSSSLIVDADVNGSAAIAGTKVSPNFGSQNVLTTGTLGAGATTVGALVASSTRSTNLGLGSVRSDNAGNLSIVTAQSITGQLSNVTDANAKAVLTSIINALTAAAPGPAIATNNTT